MMNLTLDMITKIALHFLVIFSKKYEFSKKFKIKKKLKIKKKKNKIKKIYIIHKNSKFKKK